MGLVSGFLVCVSMIPYFIRVIQGVIEPNPVTWLLWAMIGLVMLITYRSSGAEANLWPAVAGFVNPLIVAVWVLKNWAKRKPFDFFEYFCCIFCVIALVMWIFMRESRYLAQYALYVAIIADACAAIPTFVFVCLYPEKERPFAWATFGIGYGVGMFAIREHTFANYALPLYMFLMPIGILIPLVRYRVHKKIPLRAWREWM
ncbi:MAG: hypothetical protein Q7R63_00860 [bacterium]|nr:hypothetical protein [bacterium]